MLSESDGGYGFKQSKIDPCIFYKDGVTVITWVDDCLIFTRKKCLADDLILNLKKKKFTLSEDDDVSSYLGVKMELDEESGKVTMSQPFLTDRIIELLGDSVKDANVKDTPAVYKEILHKDELGPERKKIMEVAQCNWYAELSSSNHSSKHTLCCSSMCPFLC